MSEQDSSNLPADAPWWARWLDANFRDAWRWASVRWPAACAVLAETYAQNPQAISDYMHRIIPAQYWPHVIALAFALSVLWRVVNLKPPAKDPAA